MKESEENEQRRVLDAEVEISQKPSGFDDDLDDAFSDADSRSVASAPIAPDGTEELNGWNELTWPGGIMYRGYWRENHLHVPNFGIAR